MGGPCPLEGQRLTLDPRAGCHKEALVYKWACNEGEFVHDLDREVSGRGCLAVWAWTCLCARQKLPDCEAAVVHDGEAIGERETRRAAQFEKQRGSVKEDEDAIVLWWGVE